MEWLIQFIELAVLLAILCMQVLNYRSGKSITDKEWRDVSLLIEEVEDAANSCLKEVDEARSMLGAAAEVSKEQWVKDYGRQGMNELAIAERLNISVFEVRLLLGKESDR